MYFKLKSNVIFRNYESFGYLTDNRNFGYKHLNDDINDIGDKILSESGAVFISVLDKKAQSIYEIATKIKKYYVEVDIETIKNDARDLYSILEQDGFIISGETFQKCNEKVESLSSRKLVSENSTKDYYTLKNGSEKRTQDFFEEFNNGKPMLTNMHIEITSMCNERCIHCYIPHENKINHIQPELFYEIIEQCKELRLIHLTISGGEPMLHKNFCNFLRIINDNNFSVNVLSNLTLLTDEIIDEMKLNPLLGVQVSLYSMNPYVHDKITGINGSFERTKKAIIKLIDNHIPLQISCPILKENKDCYNDVKEWAKKLKIQVGDDYVIIARYNHTTQNLDCRLSINEIKDLIYSKITKDKSYLEKLEMEARNEENISLDDYVCSICHSSICIADNGDVYPCAGWQDYVVGNVKQTSLKDIWERSEKVLYLRNLRKKDFPKCIQCADRMFCTMCMVRNANENPSGDPLKVNEFYCNISKSYREIVNDWKSRKINS